MKHAELVERAERWLRKTRGCTVVLTEFVSTLPETPDAIGWRVSERWSILVEAKVSRADFFRDREKPHRILVGIGQERWFLTAPGLVAAAEVPDGWGLLEAGGRQVRVAVPAPTAPERGNIRQHPVNLDILANEAPLLLSALRRHHCRTCFKDINSRRAGDAGAEREARVGGRHLGVAGADKRQEVDLIGAKARHGRRVVPPERGSEPPSLPPEGA